MPHPAPDADLPPQAWLALLRQELSGPVAAVREAATHLHAKAARHREPDIRKAVRRVLDRASDLERMLARVLTAPADLPDPRTLRHDVRSPLGFVISTCEDLAETAAAQLNPELDHAAAAARTALTRVDALNRQSESTTGLVAALKLLEADVARDAANPDRTQPGRVLLVDDDEFNRDLLAKLLRALGHTVEAVSGGEPAKVRLTDRLAPPVDVILCDVLMPGVSGLQLLRWIKTDPALWPIPVIMVSALEADDGVLACIAAGAEDYLTRPVKSELLRARIAGSLEKKRLRDRELAYQARIDRLVSAMFPPGVVAEWKEHEAIRPRRYDKVGVLFLDVVGFTAWCEARRDDPEAVVRTLQELVATFEATAARHGVQKIKTIGDAFMAAAGLSEADPNPALTLLKCGLDLIADVRAHKAGWRVRVGVHVGPVVTGVLGQTQFSFDVWGHTVNAAARMESNGRAGMVTLSEDAWNDVAAVATGTPREATVKGIGELTVWDVPAR